MLRRNEHGKVGLAAGARESSGDVFDVAVRIFDAEDEHVLSHPAFLTAKVGSDTKSEALLALEDVTAVAGVDGVDGVVLRPVADVSLFGVGVAGCVGTLDPVSGIGADRVKDSLTDSGDDVHVADDIDGVGDFQAVLCERGTDFAHAVRDDIHGLALVAATDDVVEGLVALIGIHPVICRTCVLFCLGADECSVLNTGNVVGLGPVIEASGILVLIHQDHLTGLESLISQRLELLIGAVDPNHIIGLGKSDHLIDPFIYVRVLGQTSHCLKTPLKNVFEENTNFPILDYTANRAICQPHFCRDNVVDIHLLPYFLRFCEVSGNLRLKSAKCTNLSICIPLFCHFDELPLKQYRMHLFLLCNLSAFFT